MPNPKFVAIDDAARDGEFHLLRDIEGHQHCARWNPWLKRFAYGNGEPVARPVSAYASRNWAAS